MLGVAAKRKSAVAAAKLVVRAAPGGGHRGAIDRHASQQSIDVGEADDCEHNEQRGGRDDSLSEASVQEVGGVHGCEV